MELTPLISTFALIALAELGDKTQLTVIALSARYDRKKVFAGVVLAFIVVTGLGVLVGEGLLRLIPENIIKMIAGFMFIVFGIMMLRSKEDCEEANNSPVINPFISTFSMIALAEMGDKTQLSAITLSAKYNSPYLVFTGAVIALAAIRSNEFTGPNTILLRVVAAAEYSSATNLGWRLIWSPGVATKG